MQQKALQWKKLCLFDVDKTLLLGTASHRKAFHRAFQEIFGIQTSVDVINHQGLTDLQIVIRVLKKNGFNEGEIKSKLKECEQFIVNEFKKEVKNENIVALPGAKELLEELSKRKVLLGTVTGNLEPIGWSKLEKAGLKKYFKFGAFGSDALERRELVKIALKKAENIFRVKCDSRDTFLFGDTPRDIDAGKNANVITIGVATGKYSMEELKEAGADFVLENLKDTKRILGIIFNERV